MNIGIKDLYLISKKKKRNIIGLMSGTSLDGLDMAFCEIEGFGVNTKVKLKQFDTIEYPSEVKEKIRKIFAVPKIDFQYLTLLNEWLGKYHASLINQFLQKNKIEPSSVDIIASHGQTVFHAPKSQHSFEEFGNATLQIGDGDHIAVDTGIITISDFRQKHIAAGGEGAPLAVYGDYYIFTSPVENRILLNIGGIANYTYLPAGAKLNEIFVTDTGPGNTLLDAFIRENFPELSFDKDAEIAIKGNVNQLLLDELKTEAFFALKSPKTTGPELFSVAFVKNAMKNVNLIFDNNYDIIATLTRFTAETIAENILKIIKKDKKYNIYLSGGGAHNPLIIKYLKELLPAISFDFTDSLGISGDAKEAILFAILANETIAGEKPNFGQNNNLPSVRFGKISLPN